MNIKISKSEWQSIGAQMGWIKTAQNTYGDSYWAERDGAPKKGEDSGSSGSTVSEKDQEIMGEIVDHNARVRARLGGGGKPDENDRYAAHKIISEAKAHGHEGLAVNSDGMIVKTQVVSDWLGRGDSIETNEPIKADSKPWGKNWTTVGTNHPGHPL